MNFETIAHTAPPVFMGGVFDCLAPPALDLADTQYNKVCQPGNNAYLYYPGQWWTSLNVGYSVVIPLPGWFNRAEIWLAMHGSTGFGYNQNGAMPLLPVPAVSPIFTVGMAQNQFFNCSFYSTGTGVPDSSLGLQCFVGNGYAANPTVLPHGIAGLTNTAPYWYIGLVGDTPPLGLEAIVSQNYNTRISSSWFENCQDSINEYPSLAPGFFEQKIGACEKQEGEKICYVEIYDGDYNGVWPYYYLCQPMRATGVFNQIVITRPAGFWDRVVTEYAYNNPCGKFLGDFPSIPSSGTSSVFCCSLSWLVKLHSIEI